MDFDLDALLRRLLETQKKYVVEDRENYSCAMVAVFTASGEKYIRFAKFDSWEEKVSAYRAIVDEAKLRHATLMVTVNHAYVARQNFDPESYEWGSLDESNSERSIVLTASGPGDAELQLDAEVFSGPGWCRVPRGT